MDYIYIDLILHAYVGFVLFIALIALLRSQSHRKHEESEDVKQFVASSPQLKQVLSDVVRANDISDNSLQLLVNLKGQQQDIKTEVDKTSSHIAGLEQSVRGLGESTQRLNLYLSGAQPKGVLGENVVWRRLAQLPPGWLRRDVQFRNGTHVEFCVCSPDGRLIPIDSKWAATEYLDELEKTTDKNRQEQLIKIIKNIVYNRAMEVRKYLDDDRTIGFCIAAVPDSVFEYCLDVQAFLIKSNVVLISYSLLIPYLLLLVKLFLSNAQATQALQTAHLIERSLLQIQEIQELIDTDVRTPLGSITQQQMLYSDHNEQLKGVLDKLSELQRQLTDAQSSFPNGTNDSFYRKIASIPDNLQHLLPELRDNLHDGNRHRHQDDSKDSK